jgi:hypothetical protein
LVWPLFFGVGAPGNGVPVFVLATVAIAIDPHGVMAIWYFLRTRPGELRPLPRAQVEAFFSDRGLLPNDHRVVRYAEVVVQLENRKAVAVVQVGCFQCRALADGTIDRKHLQEVMALAGEAAFGRGFAFRSTPGVVDAGHRFAKRRLQHVGEWQLSDAEQAALRTLVNHKAGRTIM